MPIFSQLPVTSYLKLESQYDTRGSCATGLENRRQATAGAAGAQHQIEHRSGLAEQRARKVADRIGEIGVVQRVERLNAKLQRALLPDQEFAPPSQIDLRH